jgi:hypothetical protein
MIGHVCQVRQRNVVFKSTRLLGHLDLNLGLQLEHGSLKKFTNGADRENNVKCSMPKSLFETIILDRLELKELALLASMPLISNDLEYMQELMAASLQMHTRRVADVNTPLKRKASLLRPYLELTIMLHL